MAFSNSPETFLHKPGETTAYSAELLEKRSLLEYAIINLLGWIPRPLGTRFRQLSYGSILGTVGVGPRIYRDVELIGAKSIHLGNQVVLERQVQIAANAPGGNVTLGNRVMLDRGVDIRVVPGFKDCRMFLDDGVYIGPYTCLAGPGSIYIGKNSMIASHCGLYANNHIFSNPNIPIAQQGITRQGIVIEEDCWLGTNVKVLDGVRIGKGCVVGAGAVVTKDLPPYSVAVGVPARCVARREQKPPSAQEMQDAINQAA